jgi:hypothetical protein
MDTKHLVLDAIIQIEIIKSLSEKLRSYYIFPEIAEQICLCLRKHLEAGEYADITEGDFFALALTLHLQEVNHDEHLWVRWHPELLPDGDGPLRLNQEWRHEQRLEASLNNYGFYKLERLPGNVGYIDIHYFHRPAWGGDTAVAALTFLANTNALIIDLRNCLGGYPGMIALISSYFFSEEPIHLDSIYWREEDITQQYWTLPYIPGKRYGEKPVFILVSKITFSGGEEFAYSMKIRQRATLIGEKTDGGAHAGVSYRLHPHFEVFIPVGRVTNPITGGNWEGCGVLPDIPVSPEQALKVAYKMALQSIIESMCEPVSRPLSLLLNEAQTALRDLENT